MKRILCVLLSILLIASAFTLAVNAVGEGVENDLSSLPAKADGTNRFFFYRPDFWDGGNPNSDDVYIYWWEGTDACPSLPGYIAYTTGVDGIYYYDVPEDVTCILWDNGIYQSTDDEIAYRSYNYNTEFYESHESRFYPNGTDNFDGMIYVLDYNKPLGYADSETHYGELFYYYGNGEYGLTPDKADASIVLNDDTVDLDALYEEITAVPEATADEATKDESTVDQSTPDEPEQEPVFPTEPKPYGTNRYYFYLPSEWINDYAFTAGIYWWEGSISGEYWPGNMAKDAGVEGVYYYDVATDTPTIIWNNYLDGGMDNYADIYTSALQSVDIPVSSGEYDGMIFVINHEMAQVNSYNGKVTYGGQWYYYYGSGEYGNAPTKAEAEEVFTNRSFGEWATPDEAPTDPVEPTTPVRPTTPVKPTEPVEVPSEPVVTDPTEPVVTEPSETTEPSEPSELPTEPSSEAPATNDQTSTTPGVNKVTYLTGDADGNGKVNVKDVTTIQKFAAKLLSLDTENAELAADVNLDTKVNIKDATAIQKYLAKITLDIVIGEYVTKEI